VWWRRGQRAQRVSGGGDVPGQWCDLVEGEPAGGQGAGLVGAPGAGSAGPAAKVDLNTATVAQLDTLPGVGPVTAQHIVDWRTRNGRFARVDQLREIDGIGERRFQQLRDLVMI
jgi:competence protein ComEA